MSLLIENIYFFIVVKMYLMFVIKLFEVLLK